MSSASTRFANTPRTADGGYGETAQAIRNALDAVRVAETSATQCVLVPVRVIATVRRLGHDALEIVCARDLEEIHHSAKAAAALRILNLSGLGRKFGTSGIGC